MRIAVTGFIATLACGLMMAQTTSAVLSGTVTDATGGAVPSAAIVALNTQTGVSTPATTNERGIYIYPALQPGIYQVSAEIKGFRKAVKPGVELAVGARVSADLQLEVGSVTEVVEVEANASALEAVGSSIGNVVNLQRIQDLPLQARDTASLIALQAGVVGDNFNGLRTMSQNVTFEGINIQETRYNGGYSSGNLNTFNSVDKVAEFRVITAPADAEYGRGSGQVQMIGRSGTNNFTGSVFEFNRVTALSANTWANNRLGRKADGTPVQGRNFLIRNQYGARLGGPVIKNRTFFFFLFEGQRQLTKNSVNSLVYTAAAKQGNFRFFPGVRNGNAQAAVPTVDNQGNPLRPAAATGDLQTVSLFNRDPNRPVADPSGVMQKYLSSVPLPNNYLLGDGLNTAGHIWARPATSDNDMYNLKVDHSFGVKHRAFFSMNKELYSGLNQFRGNSFPDSNTDSVKTWSNLYVLGVTSSITPTLLNEFHAGVNRFQADYVSAWENPSGTLPAVKGQQFFVYTSTLTVDPYNVNMAPQGRRSPIYQYSDNVTWLKGRHAFKGGAEVRFGSSNGFNAFYVVPEARIGAPGTAPVTGITTIAGIGNNATVATSILNDLAGSLTQWTQAFNSPGGKDPQFLAGENNQRTWRQREYSGFFKDDWRVRPDLTLNLGVRWEFYDTPFEANGKAVVPVGGSSALFGMSGTSWADAFTPGIANGQLTQLQLVGPSTNSPDQRIFNRDMNNFAPFVGMSWSLPWLGKDKTIFRAGYGMAFDRNMLRNMDTVNGDAPGINQRRTILATGYMNFQNIGVPFAADGKPLQTVPLTDRTQSLRAFDTNLRTPYTQSWNASLQRELMKDTVLTVRYVGTKGTKLLRSTNINEVNIFENGFADAFTVTQAGGNAALFDKMFAGLSVPGKGVVDGVNVRGSDYVRSNSTFQAFLANGTAGGMALNLNSSPLGSTANGGLLRKAGLAENFFVANPQFTSAFLLSNYANSSYHSLQIEVERRFKKGFMVQSNYTFSKALGEDEGEASQSYDYTYRTARNRSFDKRLLTYDRRNVWKGNGTWELPFGKGQRWANSVNPALQHVVGGWKVSGIFTLRSGQPVNITSPLATFNREGATNFNTPDVVGNFNPGMAKLTFDGNGPLYFAGYTLKADPRRNNVADAGIRGQSTLFALYDPQGNLVLQNPNPGTLGTLGRMFITTPRVFNTDLMLAKGFRITERINTEIRADFINASNTPYFSTITSSINDANFGRLGLGGGNRIIVLGARVNF